MQPTAGIVIIGDEILSGKFAEENARFLIGALASLGVALRRVAIIPDELDDIADTVRSFSERFDHVFTSGGVGPTHDDVTMAGIARGFGVEVVVHPELEAILRGHWGASMPAANIRLAHVPDGADLVPGPRWPVVRYRNVYILPGVPALFRSKFEAIAERFRGTPMAQARIKTTGDEGTIAPHLDEAVQRFPAVKIGSYPRLGEVAFRVILTLESRESAALDACVALLSERLGELVVAIELGALPLTDVGADSAPNAGAGASGSADG